VDKLFQLGRVEEEVGYKCEVIADVPQLLQWAINHCGGVRSTNKIEQEAREFLPGLFGMADLKNTSLTYFKPVFYKLMRPWIGNIVSCGAAKVFCLECNSIVENLRTESLDGTSDEWKNTALYHWTVRWKCEKGHLLYCQEHNINVMFAEEDAFFPDGDAFPEGDI